MDMNIVAAEYRARGWRVMPVNGKTPIYQGWANDDWVCPPFKPGENIGIITGKASGLVVLDVDPKNGGVSSLLDIIEEFGPTGAPQVRTGSGGQHFYYRHPQAYKVPCSASRIAPGLDIRGDGGFVVAPPSVHPVTGYKYSWDVPGEPKPMPSWLLLKVGSNKQLPTKRNKDEWAKLVASRPIDGTKHDTLVKLSGYLLRFLPTPVVVELMQVWNRDRLGGAATEEEVTRVVWSLAVKEQESDG
jgi:hypothetical protein